MDKLVSRQSEQKKRRGEIYSKSRTSLFNHRQPVATVADSTSTTTGVKMCEAPGLTSININSDLSPIAKEDSHSHSHPPHHNNHKPTRHNDQVQVPKQNQVGTVMLFGVPIVSLVMDGKERLCLAQISSTLLKEFSYNEIHNRRVALGITCIQCTPVQLEILRRAGAMPVTSRRCGMITRREAERLCQSFLGDHAPPQLPENFAFDVYHECAWGCRGAFVPSRYNSSRAKCIRCSFCQLFFSPNKFIFHSHRLPDSRYVQPDAANFNSWRRHLRLCGDPPEEVSPSSSPVHFTIPIKETSSNEVLRANSSSNPVSNMATAQIVHAWEDVKAMFNGGTRKRLLAAHSVPSSHMRRTSNVSGKTPGHSSGNGSSRSGTPQSTRHNHGHGYTQSHTGGFVHEAPSTLAATSPNSFLTAPPPILSPSSRIETIWNPGISPTAPLPRQCHPLPPLPFHPLSIPWLRRPLFPFSHPFGPTCKLLGEPTIPENLTNMSARQSHSAFKPVARNAEHLFSWLNNNNIANSGNIINNNSIGSSAVTLPEDLSLNSGGNSESNPSPPSLISHHSGNSNNHNDTDVLDNSNPAGLVSLTSSNEDSSDGRGQVHGHRQGTRSGKNNHNHDIQLLRTIENDSDDDENVDIESTEAEECSSTSSVWMANAVNIPLETHHSQPPQQHHHSSSHHHHNRKRSFDSGAGEDDREAADEGNSSLQLSASHHSHHSNNNRSTKKKRLWDCDRRLAADDDDELEHEGQISQDSRGILEIRD